MSKAINGYSSRWRGRLATLRVAERGCGRGVRVALAALRIGLAGWAYGALVMWVFIGLLRGLLGRPGLAAGALVAHVIGAGPRGAITGFAATMGVPVHWQVPLLRMGGWASPASLAGGRPWLASAVIVPLLAGVLMGWLTARSAAHYKVSARLLLVAAAAGFALIGAGAVLASGLLGSGPLVSLTASPAWTLPLGAGWAVLGGGLGLALRTALARHHRLPRMTVTRRVARKAAAATATLLVLGSPVIVAGAAEAGACAGNPNACTAGNDGFIAAISDGAAGLNASGPSASMTLNSGYHFQSYLNFVQEFWMTHETNVYWNDNSRMIWLLQKNTALADQAAATLQTWEPALAAVGTVNASNVVITQTMVDQANSLAQAFENADLTFHGGALAHSIQTEEAKIVPDQLVGLTVTQAVNYFNQHIQS